MSTKAYSSYTVIDVVDGMQWQDAAASHPEKPKAGWAYYNTQDKKSYLYDGEQWVVFASDGGDAYTVILTNESHSFAGSTSAATSYQEAITKVMAYKGSTEMPARIVSINGVAASTSETNTGVTGLSFQCSTISAETSPQITFTTGSQYSSTTRFTTTPCSIPIVIEVDGQQFSKTFSCSIAFQGATGSSATSYWLIASDSVIQKSLAPMTLTFKGYYQTGTGSVYSYNGRWVTSYTTDGSTYVELYRSTSNQYSTQVTVDPSYKAIRCQMYLSGGTTTLLDEQTVPIVGDGYTPVKGVDYFDGTNGTDGTSIVWKGEFDAPPNNPENGWAYYDKTQHASYVYQDGWYQMSIDGVDGKNGNDGTPIVWKGELSQQPTNGETNWVYKDSDDGIIYICTGNGLWEPMVFDGEKGTDGLSVFITYNDSEDTPNAPTGDGTSNGWHTNATSGVVWMSQKVAESATDGAWGAPIKIKGEPGKDGNDGNDGDAGHGIDDEVIQYCQHDTYATAPTSGWSDEFPAAWDKYKPYVWKRTKQVWNYTDENSAIVTKYTAPQLMSQLDVATIMAQKEGKTVAEWCVINDVTVISGSQIATGTIDADRMNVNSLSAISANLGNITTGEIRSNNYGDMIEWENDTTHYSDGLSYTLNGDSTAYIVSGIGTCEDVDIVIPPSYNGLPVRLINNNAFQNCTSIQSVVIPHSVDTMGSNAFRGCTSLQSVIFDRNSKLTNVGTYSFNGCSALTHVSLPESLTTITIYVFGGCSSLASIVIPQSVSSIGSNAFYGCTQLNSIIIPIGMTTIDSYAFRSCLRLNKMYYEGTVEQWNNVTKGSGAIPTSTKIYYYSENIPIDSSNKYWYRIDDGFKLSCSDNNMIDSKYFKVTQEGRVSAQSGKIGALNITEDSLFTYTNRIVSGGKTGDGTFAGIYQGNNYRLNDTHAPRFFAGASTVSDISENSENVSWDFANAPFIVYENGYMQATSGTIGCMHVDANQISCGTLSQSSNNGTSYEEASTNYACIAPGKISSYSMFVQDGIQIGAYSATKTSYVKICPNGIYLYDRTSSDSINGKFVSWASIIY